MYRIPALLPLFGVLLPGCFLVFNGDCGETVATDYAETWSVTAEEWAELEGDTAGTDPCLAACEQELSARYDDLEIESCDVSEPGAHDEREVRCVGTATYVYICKGRPPLRPPPPRHPRTLGGLLAASAEEESASVHAFLELASNLRRHGAPPALVAAARRSAAEEVGHARMMGTLARSAGGRPRRVPFRPAPPASLETMALHNATHGTVGETWAALLAAHQSVHAPAKTRATYLQIAREELVHARLSWAIDRWASARIGPAFAARLDEERRRAGAMVGLSPTAARHAGALGLPAPGEAERLKRGISEALWA